MTEHPLMTQVIAPVVLGGVSNMVLVKSRWFDALKTPIDEGRCARDGRRMFGDNKTWKGFWGMVVLTAAWSWALQGLWPGRAAGTPDGVEPFTSAAGIGALLGLAYVLAELPNSYLKRRLDIEPGRHGTGWPGAVFLVVDQIDSVLGCLVVAWFLVPIRATDAVWVVVACGALHLGINRALFHLRLKNQKH